MNESYEEDEDDSPPDEGKEGEVQEDIIPETREVHPLNLGERAFFIDNRLVRGRGGSGGWASGGHHSRDPRGPPSEPSSSSVLLASLELSDTQVYEP